MHFRLVLLACFILLNFVSVSAQRSDSLLLKISSVESKDLIDLYAFENIAYFKLSFSGLDIHKQYFVVTSEEFRSGKPPKRDTIMNSKFLREKSGSDTFQIRVMSKGINKDTVKFQFGFPRFAIIKTFTKMRKENYALIYATANRQQFFERGKPVNLLVYSLPYEDPKRPGYLFYCELSREGIPPEQWGEKFKVPHYIVFKIHFID